MQFLTISDLTDFYPLPFYMKDGYQILCVVILTNLLNCHSLLMLTQTFSLKSNISYADTKIFPDLSASVLGDTAVVWDGDH